MTAKIKTESRGHASQWTALFRSMTVNNATGLLSRALRWCVARQKARSASRVLHLEETVSLGQKRFAAVIRVENQRFLVGGGANEVVLLAALEQQEASWQEGHDGAAAEQASYSMSNAAPDFRNLLVQVGDAKKPSPVKATRRGKGGNKRCA